MTKILPALCLLTLGAVLPASAFAGQARITFVSGTVTVGKTGQMKSAASGTAVAPGETVSTAANSTAILMLGEGAEIKLNASTEFTVKDTGPKAEFDLEKGGVFSKVKKLKPKESFHIRTKTAVMGIRGTQFFTALGKDLWMCVHEGAVQVESLADHKKVDVKEGQGIFVKGGSEITPPKAYEWTKGLNWNMDPAQGDVTDKTSLDGAYHELLDKEYD